MASASEIVDSGISDLLNKIILAFLEPFLFLFGKNLPLQWMQFTASVKIPKTKLFHVTERKKKCLVSSRYPHSDPLFKGNYDVHKKKSGNRQETDRTFYFIIHNCCPQVFSVNGSIWHFWLRFWSHGFKMTKFPPNMVNRGSLWWIMRVLLADQKRINILNEQDA